MRVIVTERVAFEDVLRAAEAQHDPAHPSTAWAVKNLALADGQFEGRWARARLAARDARRIVLPRHAGEPCHGDRVELIPQSGATVEEAARRLRASPQYAEANHYCWSKIDFFTSQGLSPIVLACAPLDHPDHRGLPANALAYHVDGLHRLIGWCLAGLLDGPDLLDVWLAGAPD